MDNTESFINNQPVATSTPAKDKKTESVKLNFGKNKTRVGHESLVFNQIGDLEKSNSTTPEKPTTSSGFSSINDTVIKAAVVSNKRPRGPDLLERVPKGMLDEPGLQDSDENSTLSDDGREAKTKKPKKWQKFNDKMDENMMDELIYSEDETREQNKPLLSKKEAQPQRVRTIYNPPADEQTLKTNRHPIVHNNFSTRNTKSKYAVPTSAEEVKQYWNEEFQNDKQFPDNRVFAHDIVRKLWIGGIDRDIVNDHGIDFCTGEMKSFFQKKYGKLKLDTEHNLIQFSTGSKYGGSFEGGGGKQSKGFGFVVFETVYDADRCMLGNHSISLENRKGSFRRSDTLSFCTRYCYPLGQSEHEKVMNRHKSNFMKITNVDLRGTDDDRENVLKWLKYYFEAAADWKEKENTDFVMQQITDAKIRFGKHESDYVEIEFDHYNSVDRWTLMKYHVISDQKKIVRVGGRNGTPVLVCEKVPTKHIHELKNSYESSRDRSRKAIYKGVQINDEKKMENFDRMKRESRNDTNDYRRHRSTQKADRSYNDYKKPEYNSRRSRSPDDYVMKKFKPEYKEITRTIKQRPVSPNVEKESSTIVSEGSTHIRARPVKSIKIEPAPLPPGLKYRNPKHLNQGYPNQNQVQTQNHLQVQVKDEKYSTRQIKTEFKYESLKNEIFKNESFKNESYPKFIEIWKANACMNNILPVGPKSRVGLKDFYLNEDSVIVRKTNGTMITFLTKGINYIYFSVIEGITVLVLMFYQHAPDLKDSEQHKINGMKLADLCDYQGVGLSKNVCLWIECTREEPDLPNIIAKSLSVPISARQMLKWQADIRFYYKQQNLEVKSDFEKSLEYSSYARTARESIEKLANDVNFMDNKRDCNGSAEELIKFLKIGNLFDKSD